MVKSKFYNLDTDTNLGGENSSDLYVASEKAVKTYIDTNLPTVMTGADGTHAGTSGLVPIPTATDDGKFLKGDGTWAEVSTGSNLSTDIVDVVNTYSELQAYNISGLPDGSIVEVLVDSNNSNKHSYYRWSTQGGIIPFIQPVLSANGTIGGSSFAVLADSEFNRSGNLDYAWHAFDGNTHVSATYPSTFWNSTSGQPHWIEFYNPSLLVVTNIKIYNGENGSVPKDWEFQYSDDGTTWTTLESGTNTVTGTGIDWNFNVANSGSHRYYRFYTSTSQGTYSTYTTITEITITGSVESPSGWQLIADEGQFQSKITSSNKLDADLVDDTTSTHKFATSAQLTQISTNQTDITTIDGKIPTAASITNQLADKDFVNSSIASNTANFIGTFSSVAEMEAYLGTVTNNDYAFVVNRVVTDNGNDWSDLTSLNAYDKTLLTNLDYAWVVNGSNFDLYRFDIINQTWVLRITDTPKTGITLNTAYNRYKASVSNNTVTWDFEYTLNNSSFTAIQWAAINSGANTTNIGQIATNQMSIGTLSGLNTSVNTDLVSAINEVNSVAITAIQPNDNVSSLTNDAGYLTSSDLPSNHVTTNTDQNITGVKTFVGTKRIAFKQSTTSDKLGFTLYTNANTEKGYLEFNPSNTVDSVPLFTLGNYASASAGLAHVGFRKYSGISGANGAYNLLTPLISDAKTPFNLTTTYTNFYLPLGFTDGTTTVTTAKTGLVNLSSLIPAVPTVDQTYDGTSTNAQSGTAVAEAVSNCIQYAMVITDYTA